MDGDTTVPPPPLHTHTHILVFSGIYSICIDPGRTARRVTRASVDKSPRTRGRYPRIQPTVRADM